VRWLHIVAAVAWVGGSLYYLAVLRPAARRSSAESSPLYQRAGVEFGALVDTAIIILALTGAVLAFDRLSSRYATVPYFTVLAVKAALSVWMFLLAHSRLRGRRAMFQQAVDGGVASWRISLARALTWGNLLAVLGVAVVLLSDLLRALYEMALRGRL
jgi:uncharacterized membrane protein